MIGRSIGPFRLVEQLSEGTLGTVYHAVDQSANRDAAIEILRPEYSQDTELNSRLQGESATLRRLVHPAILTLFGFYRDGEDAFLMSEFVPGETLENRLQRAGAVPWQHACDLTLQLLDGLKLAHDTGVLHGDVKPANIMIAPDGRAKLKDFGIARTLNMVGPEYLAPECVLGKPADQRSDLYSIGLVFYRMVMGRMAFEGATKEEVSRAQVEQAAKTPSELGLQLPPVVEQALMRALAKNPDYRIGAAEFGTQLREALGAPAAAGPPPPVAVAAAPPQPVAAAPAPKPPVKAAVPPPTQTSGSKKGLWIALAAGVVLIGGSVGGYFGLKDRWKKPQHKPAEQSQQAPTPTPAPAPVAETQPTPTSADPAPPPTPDETPSTTTPTAPANRAAVLAALEQTDGPIPAGAVAGSRPLHYAGILKATRIAGAGAPVMEAVRKRGVNFRLNPNQTSDLRAAGATDALLLLLRSSYRAETVAAAAPAPSTAPLPDPGPPPAPPTSSNSPSAKPSTATTTTPPPAPAGPPLQHLREVHKIAVQSKEPVLDEQLKQAITAELGSRVVVVQSPASADAVMRIELVEDQAGKVGRAFGVKNKHKATAQVVEKRQGRVLWSAEAGDRQDMTGEGARKIASRIAKQLRKDWEK